MRVRIPSRGSLLSTITSLTGKKKTVNDGFFPQFIVFLEYARILAEFLESSEM